MKKSKRKQVNPVAKFAPLFNRSYSMDLGTKYNRKREARRLARSQALEFLSKLAAGVQPVAAV